MPFDDLAPLHILGLGLPIGATRGTTETEYPQAALLHPALARAEVLIGGKKQLAYLPNHPAERLVVGGDIPTLLERIAANRKNGKAQVVLCSGDPLFYGFGARLREYFGPADLHFLPGVSSLQGAAALTGLPWEHFRSVSLHGRTSFLPLAHALLTGDPVFVLTGSTSAPAQVARYMMERGCGGYMMHVLENIHISPYSGDVHADHHLQLTLLEALAHGDSAGALSSQVLVLEPQMQILNPHRQTLAQDARQTATGSPDAPDTADKTFSVAAGCREACFGIPDDQILRKDNLFTKSPVRGAGLAALGIAPHHTVWDLGSGSGAVALEAASLAHQGHVVAIESEAERVAMIAKNRARFGAANLDILHGAMPECLTPTIQALATARSASAPVSASDPVSSLPVPVSQLSTHSVHPPQGEECPALPRPHRVFMGGGLGGTAEDAAKTLAAIWQALLPGGRLVIHCILMNSLERCRFFLQKLHAEVDIISLQANKSKTLGGDLYLEGANPVFLVIAQKKEFTAYREEIS